MASKQASMQKLVRFAAAALAANRVAFGVGYLVVPRRTASSWVGKAGTSMPSTVLTRALGARDLVLGIGALRSMHADDNGEARRWFAAHALADGADLAATVHARDSLPTKGFRFGTAMASVSTGIAAAASLVLHPESRNPDIRMKGPMNEDEKSGEAPDEGGQPDESKGPSDPSPSSVPSEADLEEELPGVPEEAEDATD